MKNEFQKKLTESLLVKEFIEKIDHPLKAEILQLRKKILTIPKLSEHIKWKAPSYFTTDDLFTFNLRNQKFVQLDFHHPAIVKINSPLLEGDYKDRRIIYLENKADIVANWSKIEKIILKLMKLAIE